MISAVDFEDIFGWGPARARTGLPTPSSQRTSFASLERDESSAAEAPVASYAIRDLDEETQGRSDRHDARTREYASVTA